jgi:serine/threonine protein kinase
MELLTKIGDYYIVKDLYLAQDKSVTFSIAIHKIMKQFLYTIKFKKDNFDYNYYRSQREAAKQLPLSIKQVDTFFTNKENFVFFEFFDSGNIISFIQKYNESNLMNISHMLVHKIIKEILSYIAKIDPKKLHLIEDLFLDNLYLTREKYGLKYEMISENIKEISNGSFDNKLIKIENYSNQILTTDHYNDLSVKLLVSFKKEFSQFFNIIDYNVLRAEYKENTLSDKLVKNIGIICFYLINNHLIINKQRIGTTNYSIKLIDDIPSELIDFVQRCLTRDLSFKLKFEDIFEHPYVKRSFEELTFPLKEKKFKENTNIIFNFEYYTHVNFQDYIEEDQQSTDFLSYFEKYAITSEQTNGQIRKESETYNTSIYNEEIVSLPLHKTGRFFEEEKGNTKPNDSSEKRFTIGSLNEEHIYVKPENYQHKKFSFNQEKVIEHKEERSIQDFIIENYFNEKYLSFRASNIK